KYIFLYENHHLLPCSSALHHPVQLPHPQTTWGDRPVPHSNLMSFQHLQQTYDLPSAHFFRFLQIRDYIKTHIPHYEHMPKHNTLDSLRRLTPGSRGTVFFLYDMLRAHEVVPTAKLKNYWEQELNMEISITVWEGIMDRIHSSSINSRHSLIQFKVVHRLHFSKTRLHDIYPNISPLCDKCKQQTGTLTHQFWSCSKLT